MFQLQLPERSATMSVGAEFMLKQKFRSSLTPTLVSPRQNNVTLNSQDKTNRRTSKWEGVPLTTVENPDGKAVPVSVDEDHTQTQTADLFWYKDPKKFCKVVLPHILLIALLLLYICVVAAIMASIEAEADVKLRMQKLTAIFAQHDEIVNETWSMHQSKTEMSREHWSDQLRFYLLKLGQVHEEMELLKNRSEVTTRWTFPSSVLYTLTIITTCGYDHVVVNTTAGRIFSVAFALVGIPLMFITAADIGKFLSDVIVTIAKRLDKLLKKLAKKFCRRHHKNTETVAPLDSPEDLQDLELLFDLEEESGFHSLWFPVGAYIVLICAYCALGSFLYGSYEGWEFVRWFHFSFNTITTVGLGNIRVVDYTYLFLNVTYIILGLAIVTMCIDLASTHLKAYFKRIHYFGRPGVLMGLNEDIKEVLRLIRAIKLKKGPETKVSLKDLKDYIGFEVKAAILAAYAPSSTGSWRYIDDTTSAASTIYGDRTASAGSIDLLTSMMNDVVNLRRTTNHLSTPPRTRKYVS